MPSRINSGSTKSRKERYAWAKYYEERGVRFESAYSRYFEIREARSKNEGEIGKFLQTFINNLYEESRKEVECPICLDIIESKNLSTNLCGHNFHKFCIEEHLKNNKNCPICRSIIRK